MGLYDILAKTSQKYPDKLAVICGDHKGTYQQIKERVDQLAASFQSMGIGVDDKVAIIHKNCHVFFETYFAAAKIGAVLVPINTG